MKKKLDFQEILKSFRDMQRQSGGAVSDQDLAEPQGLRSELVRHFWIPLFSFFSGFFLAITLYSLKVVEGDSLRQITRFSLLPALMLL